MKNLSFFRVRALLYLYFFRLLPDRYRTLRRKRTRLEQAVNCFFTLQSPERVRYYALLARQCWSLQEPRYKPAVSDEEFTAFLHHVTALVRALYRYQHDLPPDQRLRPGPLIPASGV